MHDPHENEEEEISGQVRDHILNLHINAMSWKDAAEAVMERGGNLSFSEALEVVGAYDPDRVPTLKDASGTEQPLVPGGYRLVVLRRAYLNDRGNVYDSDIVPVSFSEPEPFFQRPDLRGMDPGLDAYIKAQAMEKTLDDSLPLANGPAPKPRF